LGSDAVVVVLASRQEGVQEERKGMVLPAGVRKDWVEEVAEGCKDTVKWEEGRGSADQQECKDLNHSQSMVGMVEYLKAMRRA